MLGVAGIVDVDDDAGFVLMLVLDMVECVKDVDDIGVEYIFTGSITMGTNARLWCIWGL